MNIKDVVLGGTYLVDFKRSDSDYAVFINQRFDRNEYMKAELKQRRYKQYLRLKMEFGGDKSTTSPPKFLNSEDWD